MQDEVRHPVFRLCRPRSTYISLTSCSLSPFALASAFIDICSLSLLLLLSISYSRWRGRRARHHVIIIVARRYCFPRLSIPVSSSSFSCSMCFSQRLVSPLYEDVGTNHISCLSQTKDDQATSFLFSFFSADEIHGLEKKALVAPPTLYSVVVFMILISHSHAQILTWKINKNNKKADNCCLSVYTISAADVYSLLRFLSYLIQLSPFLRQQHVLLFSDILRLVSPFIIMPETDCIITYPPCDTQHTPIFPSSHRHRHTFSCQTDHELRIYEFNLIKKKQKSHTNEKDARDCC